MSNIFHAYCMRSYVFLTKTNFYCSADCAASFLKKWLYLINVSLSKRLLDSRFLLGVSTRLPRLKSLSTGALDGVAVLYLSEMALILGYCLRTPRSDPADFKYSMTSVSAE